MKQRAILTIVFGVLLVVAMAITWMLAWYAIGIWRDPFWTPILANISGVPYWMIFAPLLLLAKPNGMLDTPVAGILCAIVMALFWGYLTATVYEYIHGISQRNKAVFKK